MNKIISMIVMLLLVLGAQAQKPKWIKKLPTPSNKTFYYMIAQGEGRTYALAKRNAANDATKNVAETMGMAREVNDNASESFHATNGDGNMNLDADDKNDGTTSITMPMKPVADYSETLPNGQIHYWRLYQVATKGNVSPVWDDGVNFK